MEFLLGEDKWLLEILAIQCKVQMKPNAGLDYHVNYNPFQIPLFVWVLVKIQVAFKISNAIPACSVSQLL